MRFHDVRARGECEEWWRREEGGAVLRGEDGDHDCDGDDGDGDGDFVELVRLRGKMARGADGN